MMAYAPDRRLAWICGLSLVLHGLIFAALSWQRQARPMLPLTIVATLRYALAPEVSPHAGPAVETPRQVAPAAVPQKARPSPSFAEHPLAPRMSGAAGPTIAAPPVAAEVAASRVTPGEAALAAPVSAASPVPVGAPETVSARPLGDVLAAYRQRLTALLAGQQEYPRVAALRGWEGEVRLRLRVARKGNLLGVQLDHSSGFAVLDQHAVAMLEALASLPPLPEALEVNEIQVVVPINYKLKKST